MLSGYLMTDHEFPRRVEGYSRDWGRANWSFQILQPAVVEKTEPDHQDLHRILDVARFISFKVWRMAPGALAAVLLLSGLIPVVVWLMLRESGTLAGAWPTAGAIVAFCSVYGLARHLIRRGSAVPTPVPEITGFLLWTTMLLVVVEILWYARELWLWGTGFSLGHGLLSWALAGFSAVAGVLVLLLVIFLAVFALTCLLRNGKSWSEVAIGLAFIFFLPLANLHLLTYDRWYLWRGAVPEKKETEERKS